MQSLVLTTLERRFLIVLLKKTKHDGIIIYLYSMYTTRGKPSDAMAEHSANALEYDLPGLPMWKILQLEKWIDHQQDRNK